MGHVQAAGACKALSSSLLIGLGLEAFVKARGADVEQQVGFIFSFRVNETTSGITAAAKDGQP